MFPFLLTEGREAEPDSLSASDLQHTERVRSRERERSGDPAATASTQSSVACKHAKAVGFVNYGRERERERSGGQRDRVQCPTVETL